MSDSSAPQGVELLRAWVVGEELHCALQLDAVPDAATWGAVLADVAQHVVAALRQEGQDAAEARRLLREAFAQGLADAPP